VLRTFDVDKPGPLDRRFEDTVLASTTSDSEGRYAFGGLVAGEVKIVRALKPGFVPVFAENVRVPSVVDLRLAPGVWVAGHVVDEATKAPLQGVSVKVWNDAVAGVSSAKFMEEVVSRAGGEFVFEGVPAGKV